MPPTDRVQLDTYDRNLCERALRKQWGRQYEANVARIKAHLERLPRSVATEIQGARDADGVAICNKPRFVRALLEWAVRAAPN